MARAMVKTMSLVLRNVVVVDDLAHHHRVSRGSIRSAPQKTSATLWTLTTTVHALPRDSPSTTIARATSRNNVPYRA
jgi:hypothetical protein